MSRTPPHGSDAPPGLLPGRPALFWAKLLMLGLPLCLVSLVAIPVIGYVMALGAPGRERALWTAGAVTLGGTAVLALFLFGWVRAARREKAAGYTTLFADRPELWQLNPKTGEVVRPPQGQ